MQKFCLFVAFEGGIFDQLYLDWDRADRGRMPADYNIRDGVLYINDLSPQVRTRVPSKLSPNQPGK